MYAEFSAILYSAMGTPRTRRQAINRIGLECVFDLSVVSKLIFAQSTSVKWIIPGRVRQDLRRRRKEVFLRFRKYREHHALEYRSRRFLMTRA